MTRIHALSILLLLGGGVSAQGELDEARALLLSPRFATAAEYVSAVTSPAERALLEAATLPAPARARAMLTLARTMAGEPIADRALVAGAGALLLAMGRTSVVPELSAREEDAVEAWEEGSSDAELETLLAGYLELLAVRRQAARPDGQALAEAGRLLRVARVVDAADDTVLLRSATALPVPAPLREQLVLAIHPLTLGSDPWQAAALERHPERSHVLPAATYGQQLPALPCGSYLIELASEDRPWRVLRSVLVSDLDAVALRLPGALAVIVEQRGQPMAAAEVRFVPYDDERERDACEAVTDAHGMALLPLADQQAGRLFVTSDEHQTLLSVQSVSRADRVASQHRFHLAVDRPIYRPGEVVRGRLRVQDYRRHDVAALVGHADVLRSAPAAGRAIELSFWSETIAQTDVRGITDADGILAFELTIPDTVAPGNPKVTFLVSGEGAAGIDEEVSAPFTIAAFRRAPIQVEVVGPDTRAVSDEVTDLLLRARYATGAPAANLRAEFVVYSRQGTRRVDAVLDERGESVLPLRITDPRCDTVAIEGRVWSPDGAVVHARHRMRLESAPKNEPRPRRRGLRLVAPARFHPARPATIAIEGRPGESVLFAVVRGRPLHVARVQLDENGTARARWRMPEGVAPSVDLVAVSASDHDSVRVEVEAVGSLGSVTVQSDRPRYTPGGEVELRVRTHDRAGRGAAAAVVIAVVDERVFALRPERSLDSGRSLRAWVKRLRWARSSSPVPIEPLAVIGAMMRDGELPAGVIGGRMAWARGRAAAGSSSGPSGPAPGATRLRSDFRATAHFSPALRTDADGRGSVRFRLPDDLTRFRITALAVDEHAREASCVTHFDVHKPLALTPLVPRVLRVGDRVELPVLIDATAVAADAAETRLRGSAELGSVDNSVAVNLQRGVGRQCTTLAAVRPGAAVLRVDGSAGNHADAVEMTVPVQADAVVRRYVESRRLPPGPNTLPLPPAVGDTITLRLLDGHAAVLRAARRYLEDYPHGCVEQTLSRILPFFVAGGELDSAERQRLRAGLARLHALRDRSRGGFAWWPGGTMDPGMTALVLHGLVVARRGGLELARHGLAFDVETSCLARAVDRLRQQEGRLRVVDAHRNEDVEQAELAAAALRFRPGCEPALAVVRSLVDVEQSLPAGLLLRCGLALAAAGDRERARAVLGRVDGGIGIRAGAARWSRFPGEGDAVIAAARLELMLDVAPEDPRRAATMRNLLGLFDDDGFGTTYDTSSAFVALVREAGGLPAATAPRTVVVTAADGEHRVALGGDDGDDRRVEVPFGPIRVDVPDDGALLATWGVAVREAGAAHPGWQEPLQVSRSLYDADGKFFWRGPLRELTPVQVRITVRSPVAARYVAVECSLPAGCEVVGTDDRLQRHDDRVVGTLAALSPGRDAVLCFTMVPALVGELRWPPATAMAMYAPECQGGSAGAVVEVAPAPAAEVTLLATMELAPQPSAAVAKSPAMPAEAGTVEAALEELRTVAEAAASLHPRVRHVATPEIPAALMAAVEAAETAVNAVAAQAPELLIPILGELGEPFDDGEQAGAAPGPALRWAEARRCLLHRTATLAAAACCEAALQDGDLSASTLEGVLAALAALRPGEPDRVIALARAALIAGANEHSRFADKALEAVLDFFEERAEAALAPQILPLLRHEEPSVRLSALYALPEAVRDTLPPSLLEFAVDGDWWYGELAWLGRTEAGRRHLLDKMRDPAWCEEFAEELHEELPTALWPAVPSHFLHCLAREDLTAAADHRLREPALLAAIATTDDIAVQVRLLAVLAARGYRGPVSLADAERTALATDCLAARAGDETAAAAVRSWLHRSDETGIQPEELVRFAWLSVGSLLSPREFLSRCAEELEWDDQEELLRDWSVERLRALLRATRADDALWLAALPTRRLPALEQELAALAARHPAWREEAEAALSLVPLRAPQRLLLQVGAARR